MPLWSETKKGDNDRGSLEEREEERTTEYMQHGGRAYLLEGGGISAIRSQRKWETSAARSEQNQSAPACVVQDATGSHVCPLLAQEIKLNLLTA